MSVINDELLLHYIHMGENDTLLPLIHNPWDITITADEVQSVKDARLFGAIAASRFLKAKWRGVLNTAWIAYGSVVIARRLSESFGQDTIGEWVSDAFFKVVLSYISVPITARQKTYGATLRALATNSEKDVTAVWLGSVKFLHKNPFTINEDKIEKTLGAVDSNHMRSMLYYAPALASYMKENWFETLMTSQQLCSWYEQCVYYNSLDGINEKASAFRESVLNVGGYDQYLKWMKEVSILLFPDNMSCVISPDKLSEMGKCFSNEILDELRQLKSRSRN